MTSDFIDDLLKDASKRSRGQHGAFKLPVTLHPKQQLFVECTAEETLFGGSAGGGKVLPPSRRLFNTLTPRGTRL